PRLRAGRRRDRGRLESDRGIRRNPRQGARRAARARTRPTRTLIMVLVIDNSDSFTYNLVQSLGELGAEVRVRRNDAIEVDDVGAMAPSAVVISPGPCAPAQAGI